MKKRLFIILTIISHKLCFAQNKKEQILILQNTLDSIMFELEKETKIKYNLSLYFDSIKKVSISRQYINTELQELNSKLKNENQYTKSRLDSVNHILNIKEKELKGIQNKLNEAIKNKNVEIYESEEKLDCVLKEESFVAFDSTATEVYHEVAEDDILILAKGNYLLKKTNSYGYSEPQKVNIEFEIEDKILVAKFKNGSYSGTTKFIYYKERKNGNLIIIFRKISNDTGGFFAGGEIEIINGKAYLKLFSGVEAEESYYEKMN